MRILVLPLLSLTALTCNAWTLSSPRRTAIVLRPSATALYNVPPPSVDDLEAFKKYADKQAPPSSFFQLQQDSVKAAQLAFRDGYKLVEIEFPPLPASVLEMDDVSSYDVAEANLNLAIDFAKGILAVSGDGDKSQTFKKIAILLPDEAEAEIATEKMLGGAKNPYPGIAVSALRQSEEGDQRPFKVRTGKSHWQSVACIHFFFDLHRRCGSFHFPLHSNRQ